MPLMERGVAAADPERKRDARLAAAVPCGVSVMVEEMETYAPIVPMNATRTILRATAVILLALTSGCVTGEPPRVYYIDAPYTVTFRAAERALASARVVSADPKNGLIEATSGEGAFIGDARVRYRLRLWPVGSRTAVEPEILLQRRTRVGHRALSWRTSKTPPEVVEALVDRIR